MRARFHSLYKGICALPAASVRTYARPYAHLNEEKKKKRRRRKKKGSGARKALESRRGGSGEGKEAALEGGIIQHAGLEEGGEIPP